MVVTDIIALAIVPWLVEGMPELPTADGDPNGMTLPPESVLDILLLKTETCCCDEEDEVELVIDVEVGERAVVGWPVGDPLGEVFSDIPVYILKFGEVAIQRSKETSIIE